MAATFFDLSESIASILKIEKPQLSSDGDGTSHPQLEYVDRYVRDHESGCKSVIVEEDYIDRDYMEDHGVFYSRSYLNYSNRCRRVHFFAMSVAELKERIENIHKLASDRRSDEYRVECRRLSDNAYLGFMVVKPLDGCPVGRTVLRCYGSKPSANEVRIYSSVKPYFVHAVGLELSVIGLAFQQQDTGVSACATTALWCSLQNQQKFEMVATATPAQITLLASKYNLPHGRAMPSEGLSLDQMCVAVQAFGLAPNLIRLGDPSAARTILHSAIRSGLAPILVLQNSTTPSERHAVTVTGMRSQIDGAGDWSLDACSSTPDNMTALYVHDDRLGPYVRGDLKQHGSKLVVALQLRHKNPVEEDPWDVTHAIIPTHAKIRISFAMLQFIGELICRRIRSRIQAIGETTVGVATPAAAIKWSTWIEKPHDYVLRVCADDRRDVGEWPRDLLTSDCLPRYIGILQVSDPAFGVLHVLIDTTSTRLNVNVIGVVHVIRAGKFAESIRSMLADSYGSGGMEALETADGRITWFVRRQTSVRDAGGAGEAGEGTLQA